METPAYWSWTPTLQKRRPARVVMQAGELGPLEDLRQSRVVVGDRPVQPFEGPVRFTAVGQHVRNIEGPAA